MNNDPDHECIPTDELLIQTRLNVDKYGLQVITVSSTPYLPSFAYSVGLQETYNHPEIICFGFSNELGHVIINDVAALIKAGERIVANKIYDNVFENSRATFLNVDLLNINDYFGVALGFYQGKPFSALQLIWTDRNDRFPWEDGFEHKFIYKQPLLDRNMHFKYREPQNLSVFTTRQWLELNEPIKLVVHDYDGDWQFLTGHPLEAGDMKLVALHELIKRDDTLNEIFDLDYGEEAERNFVGDQWVRYTIEEDEDDVE